MVYTKNIFSCFLYVVFFAVIFISCSDDNGTLPTEGGEVVNSIAEPVAGLKAEKTQYANELSVSWQNPNNESLVKVELSYKKRENATKSVSAPTQQISVEKGTKSTIVLTVPSYGVYDISAVTINKDGVRSEKITTSATPCPPGEAEGTTTELMERADVLMTSVMSLYFGKSSRDCWNSKYPNATGPYWDGDAVIWGQGSGFSGFVAIREASIGVKEYESKYAGMTDRMFNSINRFITTDNNKQAYAVYPANGNERYYDDNVWVGLDMADLYQQTKEKRFLDKAIMVWNYLMTGYDETCGGGIHWREIPATTSKHTCSTAPTAVLCCKLYNFTKESKYKDKAVELYRWLQTYLQDPADYLYWDNIQANMSIEKNKYTYNSGQPMQAACLLYQITNEKKYLTDAQRIANSIYKKWFTPFNSYALNENFNILEPGHVWFQAIMLRGFIELYKIDNNRKYVTAYEKTLANAWLTDCRNKGTNLLNGDFRGINMQTEWDILHEGACIEMLARLASLERDGI